MPLTGLSRFWRSLEPSLASPSHSECSPTCTKDDNVHATLLVPFVHITCDTECHKRCSQHPRAFAARLELLPGRPFGLQLQPRGRHFTLHASLLGPNARAQHVARRPTLHSQQSYAVGASLELLLGRLAMGTHPQTCANCWSLHATLSMPFVLIACDTTPPDKWHSQHPYACGAVLEL